MNKMFNKKIDTKKIKKYQSKSKEQKSVSCEKCKNITKCLSCTRPLISEQEISDNNLTFKSTSEPKKDFIVDKIDLFKNTYDYNKCSICINNQKCMSCLKSNRKGFLFIPFFIILASLLFFASNNVKDDTSLIRTGTVKKGELETLSYDETKAKLQEKVDASRFEINMNSNLYFNEDSSTYNLLLSNTERNRYACNIDIYLDSDNEIIYQSPTLKPGEYIDQIALKTDLPSGEHAATVLYTIIDMESGNQTGSISVGIKIHR